VRARICFLSLIKKTGELANILGSILGGVQERLYCKQSFKVYRVVDCSLPSTELCAEFFLFSVSGELWKSEISIFETRLGNIPLSFVV